MVKTLGHNDSLELFSYHAFKKSVPPENFKELSLRFVTYARGLPLALKVLGSSLLGRTYEFWKAKLEKVQEISENDIQKILKLSYDELDDETEKAIFLDIAFFFVGKDKDEAIHVFKSCNFFPDVGIPILVDRCLLTIGKNNKFEMHNLIQDMGRKLGKSTRLFLRGNAWKDLQNIEERNDIEGLTLDLSACTDGQMSAFLFEKMYNLRLLQIIGAPEIKGNFKNLFPKLRCIRWHHCPWTHMPSTFRPLNLISIDMSFSKFKILWKGPMPIKQLNNLGGLYLGGCRDLKRLPDQLGDMKALKKIDASFTAIEKLPDSVTQLKELSMLDLYSCKKLRKLPEQIGNMQGLRTFNASYTAIQQLPDSFVGLINLESLYLRKCQNLERLPEQLGKMLCLERLSASYTAIEEVPDSIGQLSRLRILKIRSKKLKCVPESIWNLTSLQDLKLHPGDTVKISLPDSVKNMKNKFSIWSLDLSCNVRLCLPMIQCFSSVERLTLTGDGQILSSAKSFNLSKLLNLRQLTLDNCTSLGSSLPKLPLNLEDLYIFNHISLEQLPDLSSLRKLTHLYIQGCINLQSISLLPYHLQSLSITQCTSLQDLQDLSMLKELRRLEIKECGNLKSISLKPSSLQVGQPHLRFRAHLPNREVAEWFNYKSSGLTVSFDIPPSFGSNFLGLALWVVYTCKATDMYYPCIRAVITSNTESITENYPIDVYTLVGEEKSRVQCVTGEKISMKSGDRIKVSIGSFMYSDREPNVPIGEVKVKMFGVHMIQDGPSTSI